MSVNSSSSICVVADDLSGSCSSEVVPDNINTWMNLKFSSAPEALEFYKHFAHRKGFSVRIHQQVKRNLSELEGPIPFYLYYCCNKEGFREGSMHDPNNVDGSSEIVDHKPKRKSRKKKEVIDSVDAKVVDGNTKSIDVPVNCSSVRGNTRKNLEERTGCPAIIRLQYVINGSYYHIVSWIDDHNHDLFPPSLSHMIKSNRKISDVQKEVALTHMNCGMSIKSSFQLMTQLAGGKGSVGYLKSDLKNFVRTHRQEKMKDGELQVLLQYFSEEARRRPSFFVEYQVDEDSLITNIFWSDGEMIHDYECFGDFVSLDTTFRTNNTFRPLAVFLGFSHHRQCCMFGAALLFDQTTPTFVWLLETFIKCMSGKRPISIYTDQDHALRNAIRQMLPDAFHGLCSWHICKNAMDNLGSLYNADFRRNIQFLINEVENEVEFEYNWKLMVDECFDGNPHTWLSYLYPTRMHWSSAWVRNHFTAGSKTTQLSESFNAFLRAYTSIDHNLVEFFQQFNLVIDDLREKLNKSVFDSIHYLPEIRFPHSHFVKQVSSIYTPPIFKIFQEEFSLSFMYYGKLDEASDLGLKKILSIFKCHPDDPLIKVDVCEVVIDLEFDVWTCSCRKFVNWGILCRHILKGVDILGSSGCFPQLRQIPDKYILKRWTRSARGSFSTWTPPDIFSGRPTNYSSRYQEYCSTMIKIGGRICMHDEVYATFMKEIHDCYVRAEQVINATSLVPSIPDDVSVSIGSSHCKPSSSFQSIKGIKVKNNPNKSRKRLKAAREVVNEKLKCSRKIQMNEDSLKEL